MEGFTARFWEAVRRRLCRVLGIGSTYTQTIQSPKQEQEQDGGVEEKGFREVD